MKRETDIAKHTEEQAALFKALADPTRLKLVKLLCRQGAHEAFCVNAIAKRLGVTQSAVSQHLRILKNVGLVRGERRGYHVHYAVDREAMERTRSLLSLVLAVGMSD
jgi:ArsR family transcriptional regulator